LTRQPLCVSGQPPTKGAYSTRIAIEPKSNLDAWVGRQRKAKKNGELSLDRIALLDEVGFDWNPFDSQWEAMFKELMTYLSEHGHVNVPQRESALGRWVRVQRESVENGRITPVHKAKLDLIGFAWRLK
jgi:hypothetical protein